MHIRSAPGVQPRLRRPPASTRTYRCLQVLRRGPVAARRRRPAGSAVASCRPRSSTPPRTKARRRQILPQGARFLHLPLAPWRRCRPPNPRSLARVGVVTGEGGRLTPAGAQAAAALAAHLHRRWRGDGEAHRMEQPLRRPCTGTSSSGVGHAHRPSRPHATFPPALNGGSPERKWPAVPTTGPVGGVKSGSRGSDRSGAGKIRALIAFVFLDLRGCL